MGSGGFERRGHKRFKAISGAFAISAKYGELIDISLGGLSFRFDGVEDWPPELVQYGVLFGGDGFCLENILCRIITDYHPLGASPPWSACLGRRSVEFRRLTPGQKSQLEYFIWVNTPDGVYSSRS